LGERCRFASRKKGTNVVTERLREGQDSKRIGPRKRILKEKKQKRQRRHRVKQRAVYYS